MVTKFKLTEERLKQQDELLYLQTVREKEVAELIKRPVHLVTFQRTANMTRRKLSRASSTQKLRSFRT